MIVPKEVDPDTMTYEEMLEILKKRPGASEESARYLAKLLTGQASLNDMFEEGPED